MAVQKTTPPKGSVEPTTEKSTTKGSFSSIQKMHQKVMQDRESQEKIRGKEVIFVIKDSEPYMYSIKAFDNIYLPSEEDDPEFFKENKHLYEYKKGTKEYLTGNLTIRLIQNHPSIFVENQPEGKVKTEYINFNNKGKISLNEKRDAKQVNFLRICNKNRDFKYRIRESDYVFYEMSLEKKAEVTNIQFDVLAEAIRWIQEADLEDLVRMTYALGFNDVSNTNVMRFNLFQEANKDAKAFMVKTRDDMATAYAHYMIASVMNIVYEKDTHLMWSDDNRIIVTIPHGKDKQSFISDYLINNEVGRTVYDEIKRRLS